MSNKYTWVFFNLIASISLFLGIIMLANHMGASDGDHGDAPTLVFIALLASIYWIYRTIKNWQLCIRADDPNFDKALAEQEDKE